jgi:hypothetical protein
VEATLECIDDIQNILTLYIKLLIICELKGDKHIICKIFEYYVIKVLVTVKIKYKE